MGPVRTYTAQQQQRKEWRNSRALPGKSRNRPSRFLYASYLRPVVYSFFLFCFVLFVFSSHAPFVLCVCAGWRQRPEKQEPTNAKTKRQKILSYFFSFLRLFICYCRRTYKSRDPALAKMQQCCWGITVEKQS
jgi:hypothetical protein